MKNHRIIFVTGGAGYIGSHFVEAWSADSRFQNDRLVIVDNLSTGHAEFVDTLVANDPLAKHGPRITLEKIDLLDYAALEATFQKHRPDAVLHFAAKISVAESVANPELYRRNNVEGSENLLKAMRVHGCRKIVFSSTAAVYGMTSKTEPLTESDTLQPINPYGETKLAMENSIRAAAREWGLQAVIFRYFNASGASPSGRLGEWHEPETHLIPLLLESILGQKAPLQLYGTDYPTRDGTCVRDYIHVNDLADAHVRGLDRLLNDETDGAEVYNLGTETGTTVCEVIAAAEKVCEKKAAIEEKPRRPGDAAMLVAGCAKATKTLEWRPRHSQIEEILNTAARWQRKLSES